MKGILTKTDNNWVVKYANYTWEEELPLHFDNIEDVEKHIKGIKILDNIKPNMEVDFIPEFQGYYTGNMRTNYFVAKLI